MYEKWYYFQSAAFILREITNYFVSNDTSYSVRIHTVCMLLELETNLSCIDKCQCHLKGQTLFGVCSNITQKGFL